MRGSSSRPIDDATLDLVTAHYARPREDEEKFAGSVLVFRIGSEWLALPTVLFDRVTGAQTAHALPHRRSGMLAGLVTVGGDLVVHLSLAALLGIDADGVAPAAASTQQRAPVRRLIVLANQRGRLAATVDDVWGVYHYRDAQQRPVPSTLARALVSYTTSILDVEGRAVGCLDGARVMDALSGALA